MLLERVLRRLEAESAQAGKAELFARLRPALQEDDQGLAYRAIGAALGMSEGAVRVAAHRLRARYRELLRAGGRSHDGRPGRRRSRDRRPAGRAGRGLILRLLAGHHRRDPLTRPSATLSPLGAREKRESPRLPELVRGRTTGRSRFRGKLSLTTAGWVERRAHTTCGPPIAGSHDFPVTPAGFFFFHG